MTDVISGIKISDSKIARQAADWCGKTKLRCCSTSPLSPSNVDERRMRHPQNDPP
jgi:hypothetical protein